MTTYTTHTLKTASPEGREILEQVKETYGFIPNLMGNMAEAPATCRMRISGSSNALVAGQRCSLWRSLGVMSGSRLLARIDPACLSWETKGQLR